MHAPLTGVFLIAELTGGYDLFLWLFIMTGIALVFYFNTSPGEPRERDYVYAGSFYAFCIWIGFGVLAIRDLVAWLTRRNNVTAAVAATVVCMGVPTILAAQNWDDHDRSHRYMARDIVNATAWKFHDLFEF